VFIASGGGEQTGGRFLDTLKFIDDFVGGAVEDAVAVIKS